MPYHTAYKNSNKINIPVAENLVNRILCIPSHENLTKQDIRHVANMIRLLSLPQTIKQMLGDGILSAGHARALLAASEPNKLADIIVAKGLSVRETEAMISSGERIGKKQSKKNSTKNADTISLEKDLSRSLGLTVKITPKKSGGVLSLTFRSLDQLDTLIRQLLRS